MSKYWDNVCDIQQKQEQKGLNTYGQTLEQNTALNIKERLLMIEEELVDALMYIEHVKAYFEKESCKNEKEV